MSRTASGRASGLPRTRIWWVRAVICGVYAALAITVGLVPAARTAAILAGLGVSAPLALAFGVRAATRRNLPATARRGWWLLSAGFLLLNLAPIALHISTPLSSHNSEDGLSTPPSYGDLVRLLAVLPMFAGLMMFPRSNTTRRDGLKLGLDVLTVVGGCFMVLWYFVLGPVLTSGLPWLTVVAAAAYPLSDLTLIFGAAVVLLRGAHPATRRPMAVLVAGLSLLVVSDTYLGYSKLHPEDAGYPRAQLFVLMSGLFLLALAGVEQCLAAADPLAVSATHRSLRLGSRLPYAALAAGCVLLIVVALRSGLYPWIGLIGGGVLMTVAVAARQVISMRENHELITRDSLTGLPNRVHLRESMGVAIDRANRTGERVAVLLIDMDGFKKVNDTLGHDAGDQLLVGFAGQLTNSVLGSDVVARLGGDEFAVLLHNVGSPDNAATVAARIVTAMSEPVEVNGEPVFVAASIGIAVTEPGDSTTPQELLHRADMAMYQAKTRPGSNTVYFHDHLLDVTP